MTEVVLYSREGCCLCDEALEILLRVRERQRAHHWVRREEAGITTVAGTAVDEDSALGAGSVRIAGPRRP